MATKEITTQVSKESYELGMGLAGFVGAVKESLADGWDPLSDIPEAIAASVKHLVPALEGASLVDDEAREDLAAFMKAWALVGAEVYAKLK